MKGVLDQVPSLHETYILKDTKLVVDLNDPPYWFFKKRPVGQARTDKFGTNLIDICNFFRLFINYLLQFNVQPIFVYSGARLNKAHNSDLATKARHLEYSTRVSMVVLNRYGARDFRMTPLITNALKQVINEFPQLPKPIQAQYETHPILHKLAEEYNCPVLTSHSEFILKNLRSGFILAEEFPISQTTQSRGILIQNYYRNSLLLQHYRLENCGNALHSLFALLRPDVSGRYCDYLNTLLHLRGTELAIPFNDTTFVLGRPPIRTRNLTRRMRRILETWPKHLSTTEQVRRELVNISGDNSRFLSDYDNIFRTFEECYDFSLSIISDPLFVQPSALNNSQIHKVNQALVDRCATANFLVHLLMGQTQFDNQLTIEEFSTQRSSFAAADPVRSFIIGRFGINSVQVFDRQYDDVAFRTLYALPDAPNQPVGSRDLYTIFRFPDYIHNNEILSHRIIDFQIKLALKDDYAEQLVVLLRLTKYVFELESSFGRNSLEVLATATYNCFMFYMMQNMNQRLNMYNLDNDPRLCDDSKDINYLPSLRIAKTEIEKLPQCNEYNPNHRQFKHVIEMLNRSIQGYCEVNSLYEDIIFPLKITEYYNGPLIYRIMLKLVQTKASGLLRLEGPLKEFILN